MSTTIRFQPDVKLDVETRNQKNKVGSTPLVRILQTRFRNGAIMEIQLPVIKTAQNFAGTFFLTSEIDPESFRSIAQRLAIL